MSGRLRYRLCQIKVTACEERKRIQMAAVSNHRPGLEFLQRFIEPVRLRARHAREQNAPLRHDPATAIEELDDSNALNQRRVVQVWAGADPGPALRPVAAGASAPASEGAPLVASAARMGAT